MKVGLFIYALHSCLSSYPKDMTAMVDLFDCKNTKGNICYFSTQFESWRPDSKDFPKETIGKPIEGWKGENWVNTNDPRVRAIIAKRMDIAVAKGCSGIDPDNVDGFTNKTGFKISTGDGKAFIQWISSQAHLRGLQVGLKNASEISKEMDKYVDFHVAESCTQWNECGSYPKDKTFFIEYSKVDKAVCAKRPYTLFADLELKNFKRCQ